MRRPPSSRRPSVRSRGSCALSTTASCRTGSKYCGGDDNRLLFDHAVERVVDGGLAQHLRKFSGALPYLELIARTNGLTDPFDARVVEAYWIGNELLDRVEVRQLYDSLLERFGSSSREAPAT
jgi:hypothetical protein